MGWGPSGPTHFSLELVFVHMYTLVVCVCMHTIMHVLSCFNTLGGYIMDRNFGKKLVDALGIDLDSLPDGPGAEEAILGSISDLKSMVVLLEKIVSRSERVISKNEEMLLNREQMISIKDEHISLLDEQISILQAFIIRVNAFLDR